MRIHYGGADPMRYRGCTELVPVIIFFEWNKQAASALPYLWVLSHVSMIIPERSDWAIRSTNLAYQSEPLEFVPQVTDLVRPLILRMNSGVKYNVTSAPLGLNCMNCGSNTKFTVSPAEAMARRKTVFKAKCIREASLRGS